MGGWVGLRTPVVMPSRRRKTSCIGPESNYGLSEGKALNRGKTQFTKKDQQMHLKSILKTHTKTLKSPYMLRSTTIFREHTWYLANY
jgi:hypothetical protein